MENDCRIIQNLDIIQASAEEILDEIAELKAFIREKQQQEEKNICSKNLLQRKIEKNSKKQKMNNKNRLKN